VILRNIKKHFRETHAFGTCPIKHSLTRRRIRAIRTGDHPGSSGNAAVERIGPEGHYLRTAT
jgi:hypothetical protein